MTEPSPALPSPVPRLKLSPGEVKARERLRMIWECRLHSYKEPSKLGPQQPANGDVRSHP